MRIPAGAVHVLHGMDAKTVNQMQLLAAAGLPVVAFLCECGEPGCHRSVPLDPRTYHDLRVANEPVLYPGHMPVEDNPVAAEAQWVNRSDAHIRFVSEALRV